MIIWGSYVMNKKLRTGEFYCPGCADTRDFILKRPRRWGHVYWIPMIPMDIYDTYVECQACKKTYHEHVMDHDPRRDRQERLVNLSVMIGQIMIHVAHAQKVELSVAQIEAGARDALGLERFPEGAAAGIADPVSKAAMLDATREHGGWLTSGAQEETLVKAIGGTLLTSEARALVAEIGAAMGMTPAHVNGVMTEVAGGSTDGPSEDGVAARAGMGAEAEALGLSLRR